MSNQNTIFYAPLPKDPEVQEFFRKCAKSIAETGTTAVEILARIPECPVKQKLVDCAIKYRDSLMNSTLEQTKADYYKATVLDLRKTFDIIESLASNLLITDGIAERIKHVADRANYYAYVGITGYLYAVYCTTLEKKEKNENE